MTRATPLFKPGIDRRHVADTAAKLHRHIDCRQNPVNRFAIPGFPGKGAIQIDDMNPAAPGVLKQTRLGAGIVIEDRRRIHFALEQPDTLAALQIDRGKQDHAASNSL